MLDSCPRLDMVLQTLADWAQQYGSIYKFQLGPQTLLVVSDPIEIAKICSNTNRHANLDKWHPFYSAVETVSFGFVLFPFLTCTVACTQSAEANTGNNALLLV